MSSKRAKEPVGYVEQELLEALEQRGLVIGKFLGKGSYSHVYLASSKNVAPKKVALKLIDTSTDNDYVKRFLPRELEIIKQVRHENIAHVYQVHEIDGHRLTAIETEFCENGDLLDKIKKNKRIPEPESRFLFRQLIEALKHLESLELVHRDLKCENIFLDRFDNVKLGDFGFARFLHKGQISDTFCGSKVYVAPEILRGTKYSGNAVDTWSAGIVLFIMVTGVMPYDDRNVQKMVERQLSHKIRFPRSVQLSFEVKQLIYGILHPVPANRWTYDEQLQGDWLKTTLYQMKKHVSLTHVENTQRSEHSVASQLDMARRCAIANPTTKVK